MSSATIELTNIIRVAFLEKGSIPDSVSVSTDLFFTLWDESAFDRVVDITTGDGTAFMYYYRGIRILTHKDF